MALDGTSGLRRCAGPAWRGGCEELQQWLRDRSVLGLQPPSWALWGQGPQSWSWGRWGAAPAVCTPAPGKRALRLECPALARAQCALGRRVIHSPSASNTHPWGLRHVWPWKGWLDRGPWPRGHPQPLAAQGVCLPWDSGLGASLQGFWVVKPLCPGTGSCQEHRGASRWGLSEQTQVWKAQWPLAGAAPTRDQAALGVSRLLDAQPLGAPRGVAAAAAPQPRRWPPLVSSKNEGSLRSVLNPCPTWS